MLCVLVTKAVVVLRAYGISWRLIVKKFILLICVCLMAQSAGYGAGTGKNPVGITAFWPSKCTEASMLWEHWITRFTWGVIAKHLFNPTAFFSLGR